MCVGPYRKHSNSLRQPNVDLDFLDIQNFPAVVNCLFYATFTVRLMHIHASSLLFGSENVRW